MNSAGWISVVLAPTRLNREKSNGSTGKFTTDYNTMELSVAVGEELSVYEIVNGFGNFVGASHNGHRSGFYP